MKYFFIFRFFSEFSEVVLSNFTGRAAGSITLDCQIPQHISSKNTGVPTFPLKTIQLKKKCRSHLATLRKKFLPLRNNIRWIRVIISSRILLNLYLLIPPTRSVNIDRNKVKNPTKTSLGIPRLTCAKGF